METQNKNSRELLDECCSLEKQNETLRLHLTKAITLLDAAHAHHRAMRTNDPIGQMIAADNYAVFMGMVEKFKQEATACTSSN
jgi:hypothetical protein